MFDGYERYSCDPPHHCGFLFVSDGASALFAQVKDQAALFKIGVSMRESPCLTSISMMSLLL
jgi:hypothetical protein